MQSVRVLWQFIENESASTGKLPLVHSTDLFRFQSIARKEALEATPCRVYDGANLLYFFYGRPAYRPHLKEQTLSARAYAPVCLVFNHELSDEAIRIMPFDSGGFHDRITHPPMHPDMTLSEFELAIQANAPMKLIQLFFENESNYFDERPTYLDYPYDDMHIDSYYKLIRARNNLNADDRVSAVELQFDRDVALPNEVSAVILPAPYCDVPGVLDQIEGWSAVSIPYDIQETFRPLEMYGAILNRLKDYYRDKGLL